MTNTTKFIVIPEYAPLYAMRKCFGPLQAPLSKPTPTPIDIIGELLLQSGKEKVSIYEVVPTTNGKFSKPIQLTLENYDKSYDEIVNPIEKQVSNPNSTFITKPVNITHTTEITPTIESSEDKKDEEKAETESSDADDSVEESKESSNVDSENKTESFNSYKGSRNKGSYSRH